MIFRKFISFLLALSCIFVASCSENAIKQPSDIEKSKGKVDVIWPQTVTNYLYENLWESKESYDAVNALMIPLKYALSVYETEPEKLGEFNDFYIRYASNITSFTESNRLRRVYFHYLFLEYLLGKVKHDIEVSQSDIIILKHVLMLSSNHWQSESVGNFAPTPRSFNGLKERIQWKFDQVDTEKYWYKAFVDEEVFLMAVGAQFKSLSDSLIINNVIQEELLKEIKKFSDDIYPVAKVMMMKEGAFTNNDSFWSLQPGYYYDYEDYVYAGHQKLGEGLEEKLVPGIWLDSSHLHRMHLILENYIQASKGTDEQAYFVRALTGLINNFEKRVVKMSSSTFRGLRMTNYSDGYNGIYRYSYVTTQRGYGPYEVSGTLLMGWYGLMDSKLLKKGYLEMSQQSFPIEEPELEVYVGPNTSRERNELMTWPSYFNNGFAELQVNLAVLMNE